MTYYHHSIHLDFFYVDRLCVGCNFTERVSSLAFIPLIVGLYIFHNFQKKGPRVAGLNPCRLLPEKRSVFGPIEMGGKEAGLVIVSLPSESRDLINRRAMQGGVWESNSKIRNISSINPPLVSQRLLGQN